MFTIIPKENYTKNKNQFFFGILFFIIFNLAYLISKKMLVLNFFILTILIVWIFYYLFFSVIERLSQSNNKDNISFYKIDTIGFSLLIFLVSIDFNFFLIDMITNNSYFNVMDIICLIIGSIALFNFTSGIFLVKINFIKRLIALQIALLLLLDELVENTFNIQESQIIALVLFLIFYICQIYETEWTKLIKKINNKGIIYNAN